VDSENLYRRGLWPPVDCTVLWLGGKEGLRFPRRYDYCRLRCDAGKSGT
jgi:hypothetical protein